MYTNATPAYQKKNAYVTSKNKKKTIFNNHCVSAFHVQFYFICSLILNENCMALKNV